ncbi:MAG TPA: hypothetical protein VFQ35_26020 [Polyangiaceae bacterium]|nr:hypothetical protein [Polyangiaceae bacterium]
MTPGDGKRRGAPPPPSRPAEAPVEDVNWDDDTVPRFDLDDHAFDRVTAIPELPPELMAKQMMEATQSDEPPPPELEGALTSKTESEVPNSQLSTAPPAHESFSEELVLEIDDSALVAAVPPREARRALSLELDITGLDPITGVEASNSIPPSSDPQIRKIADRYATGDFSGALVLAEGILENAPEHPEAQRYANNCRDVLTQMYSARLGALDQRVTVAIPSEQIRWLSLDHRSGFLLSLVDGTSSVEELLDISGMAKLDALRILYTLREERVIALVPRGA